MTTIQIHDPLLGELRLAQPLDFPYSPKDVAFPEAYEGMELGDLHQAFDDDDG